MVKIVLYKKDGMEIAEVIENIKKIEERGEDFIKWDDGALMGVKVPFLVLPDEVKIKKGHFVTEDILAKDIPIIDELKAKEAEIKQLKQRLEVLENALDKLTDLR